MIGLLVASLPFAAVGWWLMRPWTLALPLVFWSVFAWLEEIGVLPGATSQGSVLVAAVFGAACAGLGLAGRMRLHPES